jgi:hypothetical protein
MARRRSKQQIDADQIIKKHLNELGELVYQQATETSRRDTGRLQDEQNYMVRPDTVLTFGQMVYGQWNYPKGITSGEKNALLIAINDHLEDATAIIIESITDAIVQDFK